jgi:hypothetical protein
MLAIETRGASDVAKRAHQSIGQIFRFAIARELASRNPAADFRPRDVLAATESENFAHVDEKDLPELLVKMDNYNGDALTRFGLKRSAMDRVRLGPSTMGHSGGANEEARRRGMAKELPKACRWSSAAACCPGEKAPTAGSKPAESS